MISQLAIQIRNIICTGKENKSDELSPEDILAELINDSSKFVEITKEYFDSKISRFRANIDKINRYKKIVLLDRELRRYNYPTDPQESERIRHAYLSSDRYSNDFNSESVTEHDLLNMSAYADNHFQYQYSIDVSKHLENELDNRYCYLQSHIYDRSLYCHIVAPPKCKIRGKMFFDKMVKAYDPATFDNIMGDWVYGYNLDQINSAMTKKGITLDEAVKTTWTAAMARLHGFTVSRVVRFFETYDGKRVSECLVEFSRPQ